MRWFWQRRKRSSETDAEGGTSRAASVLPARSAAAARLDNPLLVFALDYLRAKRAAVRIEESDLLSATLPDGTTVRYTASSARARADEGAALLAIGSNALTSLLEDIGGHARHIALTLAPCEEPATLLARVCPALPTSCGQCVMLSGAVEPFLAPCSECPVRSRCVALRLPEGERTVEYVERDEELSFELTYRVTGHDHAGRHDAWVRLAVARDGRSVRLLEEGHLTTARGHPWNEGTQAALTSTRVAAEARLQPILDATGEALRAQSDAAYQRRVNETRATFTRLRQEGQQPEVEIEAALSRELAALTEVYSVSVEATLESVCAIFSPCVEARILTANSTAPVNLLFDLGRADLVPPTCAACGQVVRAGIACYAGHVMCANCAPVCADGGEVLCPLCPTAAADRDGEAAACALCSAPLCAEHSHACAECGGTCCTAHLWTCVENGESLCLDCVRICVSCEATLCATHARACTQCGASLCARHATTCAQCGGSVPVSVPPEPEVLGKRAKGWLRR